MRSCVVVVIFVMGNGIVAVGWQCTGAAGTTALGHGLGLGPHGIRGWDEGPSPKSRGCVGTSLGVGEIASGEESGGCELMDHFGHEGWAWLVYCNGRIEYVVVCRIAMSSGFASIWN